MLYGCAFVIEIRRVLRHVAVFVVEISEHIALAGAIAFEVVLGVALRVSGRGGGL